MEFGRLAPWQRTVHRLRRRWAPGALVLAYHRVCDRASDPWSLAVSPENFRSHLALFRRRARPTTLAALTGALAEGRRVPRGIVISFDDGYADNLTQALPLLEQAEVPATVFVASAYLDQEQQFWWDELEHLLLRPGQLPPRLTVTVDGRPQQWPLRDDAHWTEADYQGHRLWRAGGEDIPTLRHRIYAGLHRQLGALSEEGRRGVMASLRAQVGASQHRVSGADRPLSRSELVALSRSRWIEIGAHTRTHPQLDRLPIPQQRKEILGSKQDLEALLQRPVRSLAYPYGRYAAATPELARELGFDCACTVTPGDLRDLADPYRIPRVVVGNWHAQELTERLGAWMDLG